MMRRRSARVAAGVHTNRSGLSVQTSRSKGVPRSNQGRQNASGTSLERWSTIATLFGTALERLQHAPVFDEARLMPRTPR